MNQQTALIHVPVRTLSVKEAAGQALLISTSSHSVLIDWLEAERRDLVDQAGRIGGRIQKIDALLSRLKGCCN